MPSKAKLLAAQMNETTTTAKPVITTQGIFEPRSTSDFGFIYFTPFRFPVSYHSHWKCNIVNRICFGMG